MFDKCVKSWYYNKNLIVQVVTERNRQDWILSWLIASFDEFGFAFLF